MGSSIAGGGRASPAEFQPTSASASANGLPRVEPGPLGDDDRRRVALSAASWDLPTDTGGEWDLPARNWDPRNIESERLPKSASGIAVGMEGRLSAPAGGATTARHSGGVPQLPALKISTRCFDNTALVHPRHARSASGAGALARSIPVAWRCSLWIRPLDLAGATTGAAGGLMGVFEFCDHQGNFSTDQVAEALWPRGGARKAYRSVYCHGRAFSHFPPVSRNKQKGRHGGSLPTDRCL